MEAFAADARPNGNEGPRGTAQLAYSSGAGAAVLEANTFWNDKQSEFQKVHEKKLLRPAADALRTGRRRQSSSEAIATGSE